MTETQNLLAEYVQTGSDAAFHDLASRYVDLVYSSAIRLVDGDAHRAEDVTQTVFVDLARTARTLSKDVLLGGWLHRHTCFVAMKTMRGERRRELRERQAVEMNALQDSTNFSHIAPILDEAINELGEADRTAILLRFFEQHDFCAVGQALGSNEDAARMRVTRALEKLESLLKRRGVTTTAAALSVVLSTNAIQAAPVGLIVTISSAVSLAGTAVQTSTAIAMTTLQKTLITGALVVATGAGIYGVRQTAALRAQIRQIERQQGPLTEQIQQLRSERDDATNRVALLAGELVRLKSNNVELLKLRGEIGLLRRQNESLAKGQSNSTTNSATASMDKGFGTLGDYLSAENISDAGNGTPEALLQTFVWAIREGKVERLEQIGAPFGGQSTPGDVVGEISQSEAAVFAMIQGAFTNSVGFRLNSKQTGDGEKYKVHIESDPLRGKEDEFMKNFNMTLVFERKSDGWIFGDPDTPDLK